MGVHARRLTDGAAKRLPVPPAGFTLTICPDTPGFGVRVTANGVRSWTYERKVEGRNVRRTLGAVEGAKAISVEAARRIRLDVSSELDRGRDPLLAKRERRAGLRDGAMTFEAALRAYVEAKRRAIDGKALKARTVNDYLAMVTPSYRTEQGTTTKPGLLHAFAKKGLSRITGDDIRRLHRALEARGQRQQGYAMQVLRAVLRWHGVEVPGDPFSKATAGAKRVFIAPTKGNPTPIPSERLGDWWRAACATTTPSADQLRFQLLTGVRPGEAAGLLVGDFDLRGRRVTLADPKNRRRHVIYLSDQAAAIVNWHAMGRGPKDTMFGIADTQKTLDLINEAAGVDRITPHDLRATFATIADQLTTAAVCRALLNHAHGDVAQVHYIAVSETKLREAWQQVADFIEAA